MTGVALVTGANRGIGKEMCRQLAQQGVITLLAGRNLSKAALNALTRMLADELRLRCW